MRPLPVTIAMALVAATVLGAVAPGWARTPAAPAVVVTEGSTLNVRARPDTLSPVVASLAAGAAVRVRCTTTGESVTGTRGTTTAWGAVEGGYVSLAFVDLPGAPPPCAGPSAPAPAPAPTPPALPDHAPAGAVTADDVPDPVGGLVPTRSWYATTAAPDVFTAAGCAQGTVHRTNPAPGVVALLFGGFTNRAGTWAFDLYRGRSVAPADAIAATVAYVDAWDRCAGTSQARLTVIVATTTSTGVTDAAAGAAFASVATAARTAVEARSPRVQVLGGNDIELGYVAPGPARAWVDAFHRAGGSSTARPLANVGDAAGCPGDRVPAGDDCGAAEYPTWTAEDVWYVNGGAGPTVVLPGIYVTNGIQARQWANLDRYGTERHATPLRFLGALSQIAACRERPCADRVRNDALDSWTQLRTALGGRDLAVSDMAWLYGPG